MRLTRWKSLCYRGRLMAVEKDLKTILGKLKYSDDAKVVQQITAQMRQVQARMAGINTSWS